MGHRQDDVKEKHHIPKRQCDELYGESLFQIYSSSTSKDTGCIDWTENLQESTEPHKLQMFFLKVYKQMSEEIWIGT